MNERISTLDEFQREYEASIGVPLPPSRARRFSFDALQGIAEGIGDYNPLFRDPSYAENGPYGELIAPPAGVLAVEWTYGSIYGHIPPDRVSTKDLTLLYLGASFDFDRPIWIDDRVFSVERPVAIRRGPFGRLDDACVCTTETEYINSRGERVATMRIEMLRFPNVGPLADIDREQRHASATAGPIPPDPLVWSRTRRGADPWRWSSVEVGKSIPELPKGTFTLSELFLFTYGVRGFARYRTVEDGFVDMGAGGRVDAGYSREHRATSSSFDYGPQRISWMAQAVTDWMGDDGRLRRLHCQIRRPNLVGDTNTVTGRVVDKLIDPDGAGLVTLEIAVVNQNERETARGIATVELPTETRPRGMPRA